MRLPRFLNYKQMNNKLYFTFFITLSFIGNIIAQIQTTDLPQPGFETRIEKYVNEIKLIDTYEHLITEEERIQKADQLDFTGMLNGLTISYKYLQKLK